MKPYKALVVLISGILIGAGLTLTYNVSATRSTYPDTLPLSEIRSFTEVFARIKQDYVEQTDDKELLESAIEGMLSSLDPHSTYLNAQALADLTIDTSGEFGGLGMEVTMEDGFVKVVAPIDDTPAYRAGVKSGDLIIRLDEKTVKGLSLNEAVDIMRGKPGTAITLTIVRENVDKPLKITITRDIIQVKSVKSRLLDADFGYIRLTQFQTKTVQQLQDAIKALEKENQGTLKGLVLDLRNNPGGVLNGAVGVVDTFLHKGTIVYTKGRIDNSEISYSAHRGDYLKGAPMVVLVNEGSASASEIVAGALQDHKRAVILGYKTFGKGSVQTIQPLNQGGAIKLTTALYYTPNGRSIQAEGVIPDIELDKRIQITDDDDNNNFGILREADLNRHLENGDETSDKETAAKEEAKKETDYEILEALNLLKGLHILGKK